MTVDEYGPATYGWVSELGNDLGSTALTYQGSPDRRGRRVSSKVA
jgi:hypothetical protein